MKLFAKRKRHTTVVNDVEIAHPSPLPSGMSPDPALEEILKLDPSTWNAKQRRMIKRYQDRSGELKNLHVKINNMAMQQIQHPDASDGHLSKDSNEIETTRTDLTRETQGTTKHPQGESLVHKENSADTVPDLQALLNRLSSKPKRKLVRQLERGVDPNEVRSEAQLLLEQADKQSASPEAKPADDVRPSFESDPDNDALNFKKRKTNADSSELPPEERMRREEQRRLQKEAAERRATGELNSHRHPLNSERRRANKRKPKFKKKPQSFNEHDSSGFRMRRSQQSQQLK